MKQEESEASFEEKKKEIPCKDFLRIKGCRGGSKCWFFNDFNHKADKKSTKLKQNQTKQFKDEPNVDIELKQEQGRNLKEVLLELLKLLIRENNIQVDKPSNCK